MGISKDSARAFERLIDIRYRFVLGRKGKKTEIVLAFDESDFFHLSGLQYLTDLAGFNAGNAKEIFRRILSGEVDDDFLLESIHFDSIKCRIEAVAKLEQMLDDRNIVFKYLLSQYSKIRADYLIKLGSVSDEEFLFLADHSGTYSCISFFPKDTRDYSARMPEYTTLLQQKIDVKTEEVISEYRRTGYTDT